MIAAWLRDVAGAAVIGAAVTMIALLLARLFRRDDPAFWHALWTGLAMAVLLFPVVGILPPLWQVHVAAADTTFSVVTSVAQRMYPAMLALYLGGVLLSGARLVAGWLLVRRIVRRSDPVEGPALARIERYIGRDADRCLTHSRIQVPITAGWRRPVIVLPVLWLFWDERRLEAVLRHEMAHIRRADYFWNACVAGFQAMYWFSPFTWIVVRRVRLSAELACDREASTVMDASAYADVLIASAREMARGQRAGILAPSAADDLEARVDALVSDAGARPRTPARSLLLTGLLLALVVLTSALVGLADPAATQHSPADHQRTHRLLHRGH